MPDRQANKRTPATQRYLPIAEIRDDIVVLKDGTLRAVLLVSSINFALKSEDEQNAIVAGYISFLNSLESPLQIVIQSRQLDLDGYLADLREVERNQTNELLKLQTAEYRQYIASLVELENIMTKRFLAIVPYNPYTSKKRNFWSRSLDVVSPTNVIKLSQKSFDLRRNDLLVTVERIRGGLASLGLRADMLDTQSLIELYYTTYNPTVSRREKMQDVNKLQLEESI